MERHSAQIPQLSCFCLDCVSTEIPTSKLTPHLEIAWEVTGFHFNKFQIIANESQSNDKQKEELNELELSELLT